MIKTKFKIQKKDRVTVLTGAGISAESGLKTFRDNGGLWETHHVEEVATPEAFQKDATLVWRFYRQRYLQLADVKPNPAHFALVDLEKFLGDNFTLITQNVDGLHSKAGNKNLIEMHGSLQKCFCLSCQQKFLMSEINLMEKVPSCPVCKGRLRPDIVWFGETPHHMDEITLRLRHTNYFLMVGTSGYVYPAAQFVQIARLNSAKTIGINLEKPLNSSLIYEFHQGKAGLILPKLIQSWLNKN